MCYIGKATKIFIFIITVLVVTGLLLGFGLFRHSVHPKSHKCSSGESCSLSSDYPPPPLEFPIPSSPDPNASNPSDPSFTTNSPPPPSPPSGSSSNPSPPPPPPPATSLPQPPSGSTPSLSPPPPTPTLPLVASPPPPTPPAMASAPPPAFNPPSPVPVTPGPANSS